MAYFRAAIGGGGGGSSQISQGTVTVTGSAQTDTKVTTGFKPKFVCIFMNGSAGTVSTVANGATRLIYDENFSSSYVVRDYRGTNSSNALAMGALGGTGPAIKSIDNDGFTFTKGGATQYGGTFYYTAIG